MRDIDNAIVIINSSLFYTWYDCITALYGMVVCDCSGSIVTKDYPGGICGRADST